MDEKKKTTLFELNINIPSFLDETLEKGKPIDKTKFSSIYNGHLYLFDILNCHIFKELNLFDFKKFSRIKFVYSKLLNNDLLNCNFYVYNKKINNNNNLIGYVEFQKCLNNFNILFFSLEEKKNNKNNLVTYKNKVMEILIFDIDKEKDKLYLHFKYYFNYCLDINTENNTKKVRLLDNDDYENNDDDNNNNEIFNNDNMLSSLNINNEFKINRLTKIFISKIKNLVTFLLINHKESFYFYFSFDKNLFYKIMIFSFNKQKSVDLIFKKENDNDAGGDYFFYYNNKKFDVQDVDNKKFDIQYVDIKKNFFNYLERVNTFSGIKILEHFVDLNFDNINNTTSSHFLFVKNQDENSLLLSSSLIKLSIDFRVSFFEFYGKKKSNNSIDEIDNYSHEKEYIKSLINVKGINQQPLVILINQINYYYSYFMMITSSSESGIKIIDEYKNLIYFNKLNENNILINLDPSFFLKKQKNFMNYYIEKAKNVIHINSIFIKIMFDNLYDELLSILKYKVNTYVYVFLYMYFRNADIFTSLKISETSSLLSSSTTTTSTTEIENFNFTNDLTEHFLKFKIEKNTQEKNNYFLEINYLNLIFEMDFHLNKIRFKKLKNDENNTKIYEEIINNFFILRDEFFSKKSNKINLNNGFNFYYVISSTISQSISSFKINQQNPGGDENILLFKTEINKFKNLYHTYMIHSKIYKNIEIGNELNYYCFIYNKNYSPTRFEINNLSNKINNVFINEVSKIKNDDGNIIIDNKFINIENEYDFAFDLQAFDVVKRNIPMLQKHYLIIHNDIVFDFENKKINKNLLDNKYLIFCISNLKVNKYLNSMFDSFIGINNDKEKKIDIIIRFLNNL